MTDYDKLEERRQMTRSNYYAQLEMLGYDVSGNPLDMVHVVRCKDCKYWGVVDGCNWMTCRKGILTGWSNKGYGYCSYGEREK